MTDPPRGPNVMRPTLDVRRSGYRASVADAPESFLVVDIETVPDENLWKAPVDSGSDRPFPPTYAHRVIVVGCLWLDSHYRLRKLGLLADGTEREQEILLSFSNFVSDHRPVLVTYNGRVFDLPVLAHRALHCGVPMGWYYKDKGLRYRYSEQGHIDLCDWLADHGASRASSLDALARLIGLPGKLGVDGSQIEGLYSRGELTRIKNYCLADVCQTALLFLRFRLLQGVLDSRQYRDAVSCLTEELRSDRRLEELVRAIDDGRLMSAA